MSSTPEERAARAAQRLEETIAALEAHRSDARWLCDQLADPQVLASRLPQVRKVA